LKKNCCLGVYYNGRSLTALLLEKKDAAMEQVRRFDLRGDDSQTDPLAALAREIAAVHPEGPLPVVLALGADYYQSQEYHSDLQDAKQLDQTLKYDVEETFAREGESLAVSYQFRVRSASGSDLLVYAGDRARLGELFDRWEKAGLDALQARPDVICWLAYLRLQIAAPGKLNAAAALCEGVFYLMLFDERFTPLSVRSFFCPAPALGTDIMERELLRTLAVLGGPNSLDCLYYHAEGLNRTAVEALAARLGAGARALTTIRAGDAFAQGAALGWFANSAEGDIRRDGMAPRSMEISRRNALWGLSAAVTLFMLIWGITMQVGAARWETLAQRREDNMKTAYKMIFKKETRNVTQVKVEIANKKKEIDRTKAGRALASLSNSATNTMKLLFESLDKLPDDFDLQIESIRLSEKEAVLSGSVLNLEDRDELEAVLESNPLLEVASWDFTQNTSKSDKAVRRSFNMSVKLK